MRSRRSHHVRILVPFIVALSCTTAGAADVGQEGAPSSAAPSEVIAVPCTEVATMWPAVAAELPPTLTAPQLAVVRTDFRPKDVQLHLDGRFIGRARYFNGKKGYLFLAPGEYLLEVRMGGYRTEVFEIEARPSCRFDIRHRMTRSQGPKERTGDPPGRGAPGQRVFQPVGGNESSPEVGRPGGPDPGLRPDLARRSPPTGTRPPRTSSLALDVQPKTASIYLDGEFLATGEELALMVGPVAIPEGSHVIEVRAPGFVDRTIEIELLAGELKKITVSLQEIQDE